MHPLLALIALPLTRVEIPKWSLLIGMMSGDWDKGFQGRWRRYSKVVARGKQHDMLMILDLSDWAQRMTYFLGRYYELGVLEVLDTVLGRGDHFVDIGANIGMITLHARSLVGDAGRIECFEPNPDCVTAIRSNLALNSITNVTIYQCGLADRAGSLTLSLTSEHTGTATFVEVGDQAKRQLVVDVCVGDDKITVNPRVIKIDVEGFELRVLTGLRETIAKHRPFFITEIIESQLAIAGASTAEIFEFFTSRGYRAYGIGTRRSHMRHRMALTPIDRLEGFKPFVDILWGHVDHVHALPAKILA